MHWSIITDQSLSSYTILTSQKPSQQHPAPSPGRRSLQIFSCPWICAKLPIPILQKDYQLTPPARAAQGFSTVEIKARWRGEDCYSAFLILSSSECLVFLGRGEDPIWRRCAHPSEACYSFFPTMPDIISTLQRVEYSHTDQILKSPIGRISKTWRRDCCRCFSTRIIW